MISNPYSREKPTPADQRLGRLAMLSQVGDQNDLADARDQAGDMEALKSLYGIASESATQPAKLSELQSETAKNNAEVSYRNQLGLTLPDKAEAYRSRGFEELSRGLHDRFPGGIPDYEQGAANVDDIPRLYNEHSAQLAAQQKQAILDNLKKGGSAEDALASGKVTPEEVAPYVKAPVDSSPYAVGQRVRQIPGHIGSSMTHAEDSTAQFLGGLTGIDSSPQPGSGGATTMVSNHPGMPNLGWPFSHVERAGGSPPNPWLPKVASTKPRYNPNFNND